MPDRGAAVSGTTGRPEPYHHGPRPYLVDLDLQDACDQHDRHAERSDACPGCSLPVPCGCNVRRFPPQFRLITPTERTHHGS